MIDLFGKRSAHKVLSVRQPWASLIMSGQKMIENRTWVTDYRGPLLIHAGLRLHDTPVAEIEKRFGIKIDQAQFQFGAIIGSVDLIDIVSQSSSSWFDGPFGWVLTNPQRMDPDPLRGMQKLFEISDEELKRLSPSPR